MVHAASSRKLRRFIVRVADIALVAQRPGMKTLPVDAVRRQVTGRSQAGHRQVTGSMVTKHSYAQKGEHGVSP